eukprot:CAMPEP_0181102568 /NCGR_PEP_ID=MMETSP1071-20121207/14390_1 /TAXON_ID=35127 /ORGANISM="Thalassiosira sp., Strain NH16" /LENGTH=111 /DNA_ID=CAMNT_0023185561 /DNA_START=30 /DNA_END=363 /DNA_ORIENTATION=-
MTLLQAVDNTDAHTPNARWGFSISPVQQLLWNETKSHEVVPRLAAVASPTSNGFGGTIVGSEGGCPAHATSYTPASADTLSAVRLELESLMNNPSWDDGSLAPILLRLAWH